MIQSGSTESPLAPAAASCFELLVPPSFCCSHRAGRQNPTASLSLRRSLRPGIDPTSLEGISLSLSQEAMWQLQGITVKLKGRKNKRGKDSHLKNAQVYMTVSRIPHQTPSKGESHYIPHTAAKPSRLDAPPPLTRDWTRIWTEIDVKVPTHCWWFWGQTQRDGVAIFSQPVFTCITLMLPSSFSFFLSFFHSSSCCLRRRIYLHHFQGKRKRTIISLQTRVDL